MSAETLRTEVSARLVDLAWAEWAQMGVSAAPPETSSRTAADPEALLLFTLHVARAEPRLFDEVLDWLVRHQSVISVHRLRGLCMDDEDRALVAAALAWSDAWGPRGQPGDREASNADVGPTTPLFPGLAPPAAPLLDHAFARHGFARPPLEPSGKSRPADLRSPINLAFRLRRLFGVSARAEVIRTLLTIRAPRLDGLVIVNSAGFSQRNVREALTALVEAAVVDVVVVGDERRYLTDPARWAALLGSPPDELPEHRDWIQLLRALSWLLRWLDRAVAEDWSDYILASRALTLMTELDPHLRYAGIRVPHRPAPGAEYWPLFEEQVRAVLHQL